MKKPITIMILIFVLGIPAFLDAQAGRKKVTEGNRLYSEEKFDEANNKYQDALLEDPGSPPIQFNVGNVLYKKKNYEKALEGYSKSLDTNDPLLQSQAYYNMGNTLYRNSKLPESILAYERALKLNPDDQDAKYNLEFVRNKLKENAKPQQQNQQQKQQERQEQQDEDQQDQQQKKREEEQQQTAEQQQKKEMSKEEAERLLDALKENQKDMKKKQTQGQGKVRVEKDW